MRDDGGPSSSRKPRAAFRANVTAFGGNSIESVGASRTVPVTEGTPAGGGRTVGPGASGYKQDAKKKVNGDQREGVTPVTTTDPLETQQWDMQMIKATRPTPSPTALARPEAG